MTEELETALQNAQTYIYDDVRPVVWSMIAIAHAIVIAGKTIANAISSK